MVLVSLSAVEADTGAGTAKQRLHRKGVLWIVDVDDRLWRELVDIGVEQGSVTPRLQELVVRTVLLAHLCEQLEIATPRERERERERE